MAGTVIADNLQAAATSQLVIKNGVASTPPTIQDSAGTQIGTFCRAWVNFNGTGTVAINASFNVSSITDNGTGDYTVNFTTAMPDTNVCVQVCSYVNPGPSSASSPSTMAGTITTTSARVGTINCNTGANTAALQDRAYVAVAIFR